MAAAPLRFAPVTRVDFRGDALPRGLWATSYASGCPDLPTPLHAALLAARPSAALRAQLAAAAPRVGDGGASFELGVAVVDASGLAALNLYHHGFLWPDAGVAADALRAGLVLRPLVGLLRASGALAAAPLARAEHHVHKAADGSEQEVSDQAIALRLGDPTLSEADARAQAEAMVGSEAGRLLFGRDSSGLCALAPHRGAGAGLAVCVDDEGAAAPRVCVTLLLALTGRDELRAVAAALLAAAVGGGGADMRAVIAAVAAGVPAVAASLGELIACFEEAEH